MWHDVGIIWNPGSWNLERTERPRAKPITRDEVMFNNQIDPQLATRATRIRRNPATRNHVFQILQFQIISVDVL